MFNAFLTVLGEVGTIPESCSFLIKKAFCAKMAFYVYGTGY
jgi:hypothetical protein|tara:strand:+ start:137 stop:259 length:123 start_codon:yes stop_codon:yes gene_type:complete